MQSISEKCKLLKKGCWLFTLTKKIPSAETEDPEWECVISIKREMSWG
jgi:hypothetical protein